ncbi:MAG: class I SAM-dependent methyltransferase [Planctomycetota bacterium]|nr:class I SAM-dependent methyltransferase [Planctomycetota bacterium]
MTEAAYGTDLAYIHDSGYSAFANGAAPGLLEIIQQAGFDTGLVVDLGCGSGIWAKYLVEHGYHVCGVDISPAMIAIAGERVPFGRFHAASLTDFEIPECRAVTALGEVLCYLFDAPESRQSLSTVFHRVYRALEPGGVFIFDIAEVGLNRETPPTFREGDDWACLVRFEYDDEQQRLSRHIVTFRRQNELYRRSQETHTLQLYEAEAIVAILRDIGFCVQVVRHYGEYPLLPQRAGMIARKPG